MAHGMENVEQIAIVKRQVCNDREMLKQLTTYHHDNLVALYDTFLDEDSLYFVYESEDVSLAQIQASPIEPLDSTHIATICSEVGPLRCSHHLLADLSQSS